MCIEAGCYVQDKTDRNLVNKNSFHKIEIKITQNLNETGTTSKQNRLKLAEID